MIAQQFNLSGRTALVTGASSGFGAHFCKILAQHGARVIACARRVERLEKLVAEINASDGNAYAVSMDVANADSVARAFEQIDKVGSVDILVNNAGVGASQRFIKTTEQDWDYFMDTNLKSVWRVSRHCVDRMRARDSGGSIINIASILGLQPSFGLSLYATSKAGVVQLTKSMALELIRDRIRVNAICPGYFNTEMNAEFFATDKGLEFIKQTPAQRWGELDELSGPLLLLASDAGSFINGIALPVDGGHLVQSL
ncbi:MAG TPA: SDR family oxidoreductase [Spongiibacteraceae bacterium]|jgi:NAD(P)-dependent dehydrogenase (short-subunit alcohol dehydrogenase family)